MIETQQTLRCNSGTAQTFEVAGDAMTQRLSKIDSAQFGSSTVDSSKSRTHSKRRIQPYAWLGAGAVTLGLGVAMAGGAGVACADSDGGSGAGQSASGNADSSARADSTGAARTHSGRAGGISPGVTARRALNAAKSTTGSESAPLSAAAVDSAASPATPESDDPSATASADLSRIAAVGRSARPKTIVGIDGRTSDVVAAASVPNPAADPSFSMVSWVPGATITPGSSVQLALQQISSTQNLLNEQTWGSGNVFAGIVAVVPQMLLGGASSSLSNWQTSTAGAQQAVADTVGVPVMHQIAQLQLLNSLLMPSIAQAELNAAALFIPLVGVFGASDAAAQATTLLDSAKQNSRVYGVVPLTMYAGTEPIVYISVDGGPKVPVLVDTGSSGLVISSSAVGSGLGTATGSGTGAYSGGLTYDYNTYNATVDFGNGVTTVPTAVNVVSVEDDAAFRNYFDSAGVVGVLGIGANSVGPGPSHPATSLPGELSDGVLIYQNLGVLVFGPNPLPARVTVPGTPNANLQIQVGNGSKVPVNAIIDSGGVYGTLPSYIIGGSQTSGSLPAGTKISVYTNDGQTLLYTYTTKQGNGPTVITDNLHNTGNEPFAQGPVYIDYSPDNGIGSTIFDYI